ncbi:MAG TPA: tetratricopeptide repeat protein [Candidatus Sulfotelmatobacter sp.]|nr:tetratricopeptide repeat protein [Candidatus Sulfotelmatobacter sp.]
MSPPSMIRQTETGGDEAPARPSSPLTSPALLSGLLFAATLITYFPAFQSAFVNYDDPAYVTANDHVLRGLTWGNLRWAVSATAEANWHPLTWISHMADVQWFGLNPVGHHAVSVLLHAVNVLLLFFLLRKTTGSVMRSAMVAALFAVHPLNVESVAWVAERKSVLSMLLFLLALIAYSRYANQRSVGRYLVVLGLFALGLAAKPMIVTLPVLLLLWDYWPLRRSLATGMGVSNLILEKLPLLAMSGLSSWVTVHAQRSGGALGAAELLPVGQRIDNAVYSYVAYLGKGVWPAKLAVFYPHPEASLAVWSVFVAGIFIIATTALAWYYRTRYPYLIVGWLWYLIAMLPMIGIVQVGRQAMADRYAYLPFIGIFVIAVWGLGDVFESLRVSHSFQGAIAGAVLVIYASMAFLQASYWHNSCSLFSHALDVTSHNGIAEDNLGVALMEMGRPDAAFAHFQAAAEYIPQLSTAHYNLGVLEQQQNHLDSAQREYELALRYSSDSREVLQAHSNLGFLMLGSHELTAAIGQFSAALQINPEKQNALLGRGIAEYQLGNIDAALSDLSNAARIGPMAQADFWLGRAFETKGDPQAAAAAYSAALQLAPEMTEAQQRLSALRVEH